MVDDIYGHYQSYGKYDPQKDIYRFVLFSKRKWKSVKYSGPAEEDINIDREVKYKFDPVEDVFLQRPVIKSAAESNYDIDRQGPVS